MTWRNVGALRIGVLPILQPQINNRLGNMALLDASAKKVGLRFYVPRSGSMRHVTFRTGTVTVSDTLKVTIQTLASTGHPSGTSYGGSGSATISGLASNTWYAVTLGTDATAVAGDFVAVVIEFNSYVAGNLSIAGFNVNPNNDPYPSHFTSSWAALTTWCQLFSVGYSDDTYYPIYGVLGGEPSIGTVARGNEFGLRFKLPYSARLNGFVAQIAHGSAGPYLWTLYDSANATLTSLTINTSTSIQTSERVSYLGIAGKTLTANSIYRLALVFPDTSTAVVTFPRILVATTSALGALDGGTEFQYTFRSSVGAGAFTDFPTMGAAVGLELDQVDFPGSMIVHPGMAGGLRG